MPTPDEAASPTDTMPSASAAWLSVRDAAAALGISPRAVQKRAAKGHLTARKTDDGGAVRWEIDGRELDANREPSGREPRELSGTLEREAGREPRTVGREPGANSGELWREREAELKSEIAFLRGIVEGQQRDAVELRQALKRALDLAPKQLTAGTSSTTDATAINRQQREQTGAAANDSHVAPNGSGTGAESAESGNVITYDSIADELEAMLRQRK